MVEIEEITEEEKEPQGYPLSTPVELHSLTRKDWNGKRGIVRSSEVKDGRQQVEVNGKPFALKLMNLKAIERELKSLTTKELRAVLKAKGVQCDAIEKGDLFRKAKNELNDIPNAEIARLLVIGEESTIKKKNPPSQGAMHNTEAANQAADQLSSMSPSQLRQQAQMLRTMPPASIRAMNPQFANMSDSQIQMAATQMEMMANDPDMVKRATEQMKNMSEDELQRMQNAAGVTNTATTAPSSTSPNPPAAASPADVMENMTPEQLKRQTELMNSMTPEQIRRMNPQLANMTDDQVRQAVKQMEVMASNPAMMKMAQQQMKNMSPEDIRNIQNGRMPTQGSAGAASGPTAGGQGANGGAPPSTADAMQMLADMDPMQLKEMLKSLQESPEQLQQLAESTGMPEAQLRKGVEMFANMDEQQLGSAMAFMQKAQQAKDQWTKTNEKVGGHLLKIVALMVIVGLFALYQGVVWLRSPSPMLVDDNKVDVPPTIESVEKNEFDEF